MSTNVDYNKRRKYEIALALYIIFLFNMTNHSDHKEMEREVWPPDSRLPDRRYFLFFSFGYTFHVNSK